MNPVSHQRIKRKPRCPGCGLKPSECLCGTFPRVTFRTPIAIVQHVRERWKPTNTGRLFARMAEGTVLMPVGMREPAFDPSPVSDPSIEWRLLFPKVGAPVLAPEEGKRIGLVLLDGSWHQCSHLSHRLPVVSTLPCVRLPDGPPSIWKVRTQHREQGRSTFEAALMALQLLEGDEAVAPLRRAFAAVTARMLHMKGKLPTPEIPAGWGI